MFKTMKNFSHKIWFVILIILLGSKTYAQKSEADKLRLQLSTETNDTSRIKLMIQLAMNMDFEDSERDLYLKEAYDLSIKKNYRYGLLFGQFYESFQLSGKGRFDEAIRKLERCIDGLDSLGIIQRLGYPLYYIGYLFYKTDRQTDKLKYYTDKLIFYKKHGPIENTGVCFHGLANYYLLIFDYDKAIKYYMQARDAFRTFDPYSAENEEECVGVVYLEWGNLDKAEEYLKSALNELILLKQLNHSFFCYHHLGVICFIRKDYKQALKYYYESRPYYLDTEDQAINFVGCAAVHLELNSNDSVLFYLEAADKIRQSEKLRIASGKGNLELDYYFYKYYQATGNEKLAAQCLKAALLEAKKINYLPFVLKYTKELYSNLMKKGDSLHALPYLIQYSAIRDSSKAMNTEARIATYEIEQQAQEKENEIKQLQTQKITQRNYYLIGSVFLVLIVFATISRLRYKRKRDRELLSTEFSRQLAQAETKALRSQMNPHFIFNSLNSINSFVLDKKHELASDYLIKFSKLIRLILYNSRSETITIDKELETLKLYVSLESARFDNKFTCSYQVADDVNVGSVMIPPMLLQPFVENAIWHGLMQKEGEGCITIDIKKQDEEFLNISIVDDGIGREKAAELKSKSATHKSHGMKVTSQRIEMMNKLNSTSAHVTIFDLHDEQGRATGTKVELIIPF